MSAGLSAEMTAVVTINRDTTKDDLVAALTRLEVPGDARMRVEHYKGDQREPSYTKLIWTWRTV